MKHENTPLDTFELEFMPMEMKAYLRNNGFSFSKKACEWAISQMKKENPATKKEEKIEPWTKDQVEDMLKKYNVVLENNVGYNHVYVANMLKADKFKPEHLGQLNFYLEALDRDVKKAAENPSIGVLLCKDKDSEVVEYALSRSLSPTMVAEYQMQLPDKKILQQKLHELFENRNIDE